MELLEWLAPCPELPLPLAGPFGRLRRAVAPWRTRVSAQQSRPAYAQHMGVWHGDVATAGRSSWYAAKA